MRMIVTWLLGVPVAVAFFFAVFAVDTSKITPNIGSIDRPQSVAIAPSANPNSVK
jgi:hypothetical protein